jgi:hypothetical protein
MAASDIAPYIGGWAAQGVQVILLAGFPGSMPTADEARNLGNWAAVMGPGGSYWNNHPGGQYAPQLIEFGNETSQFWQYGDSWDSPSYVERAKSYALRFRDAATAISTANRNVGLLSVAEDYAGGRWFDAMYSAVPNFDQYVSGWIIHLYGSGWRQKAAASRKYVADHGAPASIPWDVTETGISTDNGKCLDDNYGWDSCMSFATAGSTLHTMIAQMRADFGTHLRSLDLYRVRDLQPSGATNGREDYFGLQTLDLHDKGGYTAQARTELAAV